MKTAAIIGAHSMLGRRLTAVLSDMGVEVISVGRYEGADIRLDLETGLLAPLSPKVQAEVIFHCAASFADDSPEGIRKNFQVNTAGCLTVLELAEALGCEAMVYAGTLSSSSALDPGSYSSYGFSKAQAEALLDWGMGRLNRRFCSLRFSQVYDSEGACIHHQPWFGRIIAYAARGLDLKLPASHGVRNFLHVDDAVSMLIAAAERPVKGILDVVSPESMTLEDIAEMAYAIFGRGGRLVPAPEKAPFRPIYFPEGTQAFRQLGRVPSILLAEGIERIRARDTGLAFGPLDVT